MADNSRLGTKLGPRLVYYIHQAIIHAHTSLVHVKHKLAMMVFHAISDEISEEVDVTLGPILQKLHDSIDETHPSYPSIHFMHTVSGQLKALAGTGLQISGLLGSISAIMNNELADIVYNVIRANPALLPDPSVITQSYAAGMVDYSEAIAGIAAQGIQHGWADRMLTLAYAYPGPTDGLEMLRRGIVTADQVNQWLILNGMEPQVASNFLQMLNSPVSVADAALAVLRGNMSQSDGYKIAQENGYDAPSFDILVGNTGEPPGLQQLLEAYRRGFIDQATLEKGILQSRYRNEWIPMLEQLRYSPISVADAVNATVQDQMDMATAESISQQNGLEPGQFQVLYNTAGEPLSRTEMEELYNRGIVTQDQVNQALRESRVKNKYVDLAFQLHAKIPPIFTIQNALRRGGMTEAQAVQWIMENGYDKTAATEIVNAASQEMIQTYRDKVTAAVTALYEDNLITEESALTTISGLGYTTDQTKFIVQGSELRREAKTLQTAVNAIRAKYLGHHISQTQASGYLDQMGIPATQRDLLLGLWAIEAGAYTRTLTEAQTVKAFKDGLITGDDALARLIGMGYNDTDANLLLNGA